MTEINGVTLGMNLVHFFILPHAAEQSVDRSLRPQFAHLAAPEGCVRLDLLLGPGAEELGLHKRRK